MGVANLKDGVTAYGLCQGAGYYQSKQIMAEFNQYRADKRRWPIGSAKAERGNLSNKSPPGTRITGAASYPPNFPHHLV